MQLQRFVDSLKADLSAVAELGDEATAEAAGRLVVTLQASVGLRLLDALSEAALELNEKLPFGHVEVRIDRRPARSACPRCPRHRGPVEGVWGNREVHPVCTCWAER